jgi:FtsZ-binding cell division protein ZapB
MREHDERILNSDRDAVPILERCQQEIETIRKQLALSIKELRERREARSFRERAGRHLRDAAKALKRGTTTLKSQVRVRENRRAFSRRQNR